MGASGNRRKRKWEWAQAGMTASGNHAEAHVLCAVDGGARRPRAGDGGAAADILSGDRPHSSAGRVLRGRTTRTDMHTHMRTRARTLAGTEAVSTPREALVAPPQIPRHKVCLPTSAPGLGSSLPHPHQERALTPCHIFTGTGPTPFTSALGLRSLPPHLHQEWAHPSHICAASGLTPPTSAPGLGARPCPHPHRDWAHPFLHLHRDWAHPFPHLRRDSGPTTR